MEGGGGGNSLTVSLWSRTDSSRKFVWLLVWLRLSLIVPVLLIGLW